MKRHLVLMAVLALLLFPFLNPAPSLTPPAIGIELNEKPFFAAGDGDESSESITSFSETTDDDVLFYPDLFHNDTKDKADSDTEGGHTYTTGDYTDTFSDNGVWYQVGDSVAAEYDFYSELILTVPTGNNVEGFYYYMNYHLSNTGTANLQFYNYTSASYQTIKALTCNSNQYDSGTHYEPDYFSGADLKIRIDASLDGQGSNFWDYLYVEWYEMHLADSDHYAESFADVSDWTVGASATITTDGDVATFTGNGTDWRYVESSFTAVSVDNYFEFRTIQGTAGDFAVYLYDGAWSMFWNYGAWFGTKIQLISSDADFTGTVSKIRVYVWADGATLLMDYLQIGPSDEMGWQHDGSTTAGVTDGGGGSSSSSGGELTLTADGDGSTFEFAIDTTATAAYLDADYYPMIGLDFNDADSADYVKVESYDGAAWATVIANTTVGTDTLRANCRAADADIEKFRISVNPSANPRLKWFKAYSIANFTVVTNPNVANVVYVEDGVCVVDTDTDVGTVQLSNDLALSVATTTYSVWNISTSTGLDLSGGTDVSFKMTVDGSEEMVSDETRGGFVGASLTDFSVWFRTAQTWRISAIKFIEDATAPDILDKFVSPVDPDDAESVTLTAVTYDAVAVYKVTLNAVVYPTGFSDVDYDLTEQTTNVLWSYEFSTLKAGYYLFQVTANDGANTYSEYIPVIVRESEITVDAISFFGVGEDFGTMTFSFDINKACSYVINEASDNVGASDTHSGSVSEGMQNIAWTKLTTNDALVNFTITFTNASLTYDIEGQYQVSQVALAVSSYDWGFSESYVTISFQTSKGGTYTVYLDDVQDSTDSFVTGSNFLTWARPSAEDPAEIQAAVKLTDGTTTIWLNQTYSEYGTTAETALIINTLIFDRSESNITAFITTNWLNCTTYIYENEVQKDTGSEGTTLTYVKSTTMGTYNVALKIDGGGSVLWYNSTYTIAADEITIDTYTFFGTSSDFSYMQYSGQISHDCTYNITEWSSSWAANETHTGSVTAGLFNIAWDKIGVNDVDANFTIVFVNGSLSLTIEGYYGTAYKLLRITEIRVDNPETSLANTSITVNFYSNKDIDWFVYDVDDSDAVLASGSSVEGSDVLTWLKDRTQFIHNYAIKWTDGVSNIWFNSSYWTYKENIDSIDQPGKDWDAIDRRKTIEFWTTVGAFVAIGGLIAIGISHYKLNKKIGNLPNYKTQ